MSKKGQSTTVIIETATLNAGACTKSRVITYFLDSSWIHRAMHAEERVAYSNDHRVGYTHAGTCTKSRVIIYLLDSSSWIHRAMHVEKSVAYNSDDSRYMQE